MRPKVLVIEDEPDLVQLAQYNLELEGFEVFSASNGVQALHEARRLLPDIILLDLLLPDIDGASILDILRSQPSTSDVPVIVVSALDGMVSRNRKKEPEVVRFFKKPVDFKALANCIRATVELRQEALESHVGRDDTDPER